MALWAWLALAAIIGIVGAGVVGVVYPQAYAFFPPLREIFENIRFFFAITQVTFTIPEYRWIGVLLISPLIIGLIWILLNFIRGRHA